MDEAQRLLHRGLREGEDAGLEDLLGRTFYHQGALGDAERCWRLALDLDPNRADTWWRIGRLALQRARPEEAVEPRRRAAELEPKAVGPVYSLSLAYRRLGRLEDADRLREQAIRLRARRAPLRKGRADPPSLTP